MSKAKILFLVLSVFVLSSCQKTASCNGKLETIKANTQWTVDDELKIGSGNFWNENNVDSFGVWLYFRSNSDNNASFRLKSGDETKVANYTIKVNSIDIGQQTAEVCVSK